MLNFLKGGMLTGAEIERQIKKGNILIDPYDPSCINPNSYNLKLHPQLLIYDRGWKDDPRRYTTPGSISAFEDRKYLPPIDMMTPNRIIELEIPDNGLVLYPNTLYIGRTAERTATDKFIPMINGRSSGGRLGISIHICAGFGDIGFDGTWTLEITVVEPVRVYPNAEIAQVCFFNPSGKIGKLYRGRYYKQISATPSKFYKAKEN